MRTTLDEARVFLESKRNINHNGCWLFTGAIGRHGYGVVQHDSRTRNLHRLAYKVYKDNEFDLDSSMLVLHSCHIRNCFNPEHLRLGTHNDNNMDMVMAGRDAQSSRTHCPQGHEYTPENTRYVRFGSARRCIICYREQCKRGTRKYRMRLAGC